MISGDESWIYEYDPKTKKQREEWKHRGGSHQKSAQESFKNQDHAHSFIRWSCSSLICFRR